MSGEQLVAGIGAVCTLVVALTALVVQIRGLRADFNGRLDQLIGVNASAAEKEGELRGRDYVSPPPGAQPPEVRERL